jgi:hypothetical protein
MTRADGRTGDGLSEDEVADVLAALDDEYMAHTTYVQVIADFGDVLPFASIVEAERRHIDALVRLLRRHGIQVPDDPWPGRVPRYDSLTDACRAGVDAEIENAALYDRLLATTDRPDIRGVLRSLQEASQQRHLPAFQRCAQRDRRDEEHHQRQERHRRRGHQ